MSKQYRIHGLKGLHERDEDCRSARSCRPVAVIDPEDGAAVERLLDVMQRRGWTGLDDGAPSDMRAALREYADPKPPKPPEPTGLGAVVVDEDGERWVRTAEPDRPWYDAELPERLCDVADGPFRNYANIAVVKILSEGVR